MIKHHQLEDKHIHVLNVMHDDGVKSKVFVTPGEGGLRLRIELGEGKVLHDLRIERL